MIKTIKYNDIVIATAKLAIEANRFLPSDVTAALKAARAKETSELANFTFGQILANHNVAAKECMPLCQDTGKAVVFIELGQNVCIEGGLLTDAINAGVAKGYEEGYLRKSMVDPISRINTNDNTPAIIHIRLMAGDDMKITLAPKGGGAENMSALTMLSPSAGLDGIKHFVVDTVRTAGANPCPPVIVGVGIGGNFEEVALLAKTALLRPVNQSSPLPDIAALEAELLTEINALNIGAQGFGGFSTALAVHIETAPCHFASLPVAVNLNCHVARHKSVIL